MNTPDAPFIRCFLTHHTPPEVLDFLFTGRHELLRNILEKITESSAGGSTHHVLIHGPPGIGKSHFTALLHHHLITDTSLSQTLHVACIHSTQTITSFPGFLTHIYRSLCHAYPHDYSSEWLNDLLDQPPTEITKILTQRLTVRFNSRKLVILAENLQRLFDGIGKDGQHQLRALLQEHPFACLITTSPTLFSAVTDRREAFFGFFQQIPLQPLTSTQTHELLTKIATLNNQTDLLQFLNTPDARDRITAIHDLTCGNHRTTVMLSRFLTPQSLDHLVNPFLKLADDLTPCRQKQLNSLSPLQQQIIELLCRHPATINPTEIARQLLVDRGSIGKQVRLLEDAGLLTSIQHGRETWYDLADPTMRLGGDDPQSAQHILLVDLLRAWHARSGHLRSQPPNLSTASDTNTTPQTYTTDSYRDALACVAETSDTSGTTDTSGTDTAPPPTTPRTHRAESLFIQQRWNEGFDVVRDALTNSQPRILSRLPALLSMIFRFSDEPADLHARLQNLVSICQQAAQQLKICNSPNPNAPLHSLGTALLRSLPDLAAVRFAPARLESYPPAVAQCATGIPELAIPLRLFHAGIHWLSTGSESAFIRLIHPERQILRQALAITETPPKPTSRQPVSRRLPKL